jgi:hypothetical protein
VPLGIDVGIGEARVIVPDDVCVVTDAEIGMGEVAIFDRSSEGVDVDFEDHPDVDSGDVTRLLVKADLGLGYLEIGRSDNDGDLGRNTACAA